MKNRVFSLIEDLQLTPTEFADLIGVSRASISSIKTGRTQPTLTLVEKIKQHFPDTDSKYKDANSVELLKKVLEFIEEKGYEIVNIDSNIICQKPKLMNYIEDMRKNIAQVLELELNQISIKAKTNEMMDSTGKSEAIQANSVVLIEKI